MNKLKVGKKSGLKYFDIKDIRSWELCYDPVKHLPENWRGTALTILKNEAIPFEDRLWVVCRNEFISDRTMRLFAVWCARQVQHLMADKRSIDALDVAERFANGQATLAELDAAGAAAGDAAWAAARAAGDAAWAAARAAAGAAARAAAGAAAGAAAWDAWDAAWDAARAAAWDAARDAAGAAQRDKLIEMVIAEGKERLK